MIARALAIGCLAGCIGQPARPVPCSQPRSLDEINTNDAQYSPWLSANRKVLYWTQPTFSSNGGNGIWRAERAAITDTFGGATLIVDTDAGGDKFDPVASEAGDRLRYVSGDGNKGGNVYEVSLAPDGTPGTATQLFGELGPLLHPTLTSDGLQIYFARNQEGFSGISDIYTATRTDPNGTFGTAQPVDGVNTAGNEGTPVISPDGATLYFSSDQFGTDGQDHIGFATRAHHFADPQPLAQVTTMPGAYEDFGSVNPDGTTIVFETDRQVAGDPDIWIACE